MNGETVEVWRIPRTESLDPMTVYVDRTGEASARVTIACYSQAWTCYWGAMGCDVVAFLAACGKDYVAGNMLSGCGFPANSRRFPSEVEYAEGVAQAVIDEAKRRVTK